MRQAKRLPGLMIGTDAVMRCCGILESEPKRP